MHGTYALIYGGGGDFSLTLRQTGMLLAGKVVCKLQHVFISFLSFPFLHSSTISTPTKAKRNTWSTAEKNNFLLLCRAEGNSRPPGQMLDCHCYGQHSHENESRAEIRRKPFIQAVFVLDKICSYKWYSSRLIFSCINGPIKKSSSTLHFDKFGKVRKFNKKTCFYSRNC